MASVYAINKGINASVEFKGLKAQYIVYLAAGALALLVLFVIGYMCQIPYYILIPLMILIGTGLYIYVMRLSNKYGEHGLMKAGGYKQLPIVIKSRHRNQFWSLNEDKKSLDTKN
ncbi:DUF4133 domain-containing protein [Chitinophaga rhizophila]|uniref:DUF4133 domain-containing protein n=1 Tax=Chitinophaga rhizophila TaxID=2866212 RepID=A0ABS7G7M5_9BACT|nr:DUF4133 domain-containing protein [Chitinophaga rhizophila]MBW8683451.1 DUF4133 domain-containing protein [Chitinophaga rhizophila]